MIEEAFFSRFSISILYNRYPALIISTARPMKIRMLHLSKEKYFVFQSVSFGFNLSFLTKQ